MLDISNIYRDIKHLKLKNYNCPFPTVFVSANDPDDACVIVINDLLDIILEQDESIKMRIVCRKIRKKSKIDKIYILN
jgi:hypothetical protein